MTHHTTPHYTTQGRRKNNESKNQWINESMNQRIKEQSFFPFSPTSGKCPSSTILSASSTIKNRIPLMSLNIGMLSSVINSHSRPGVATNTWTGRT